MGSEKYARFWALLGRMPEADKEVLVEQFTCGRTTHLHEMSRAEYDVMCSEMERVSGYADRLAERRKELKRYRSMALHLMGQWGVQTRDWERVDYFVKNPRIAGKEFRLLALDDLDRLCRKMRVMLRKREQKNQHEKQ